MIDISGIVSELEARLAGIDSALSALRTIGSATTPKRRGRPPGKKRGHMTADGRRRISEAQKARWAAIKRGT
jgi:hypothetical protein